VSPRPETIRLIPLHGLPEVAPGSDLAGMIRGAARAAGVDLAGRIVVVCQKIVSKAEGRLVALADVVPSDLAREIGAEHGRDPRQVEVVLRESRRIVRRGRGVLITETHHGFVCANSGVDLSNAPGPDIAVLLPEDPDASARRLSQALSSAAVVADGGEAGGSEGDVDEALAPGAAEGVADDDGRAARRCRERVA
jgi:coenzyme F420-0:L-glutamate ligase / coenzyme F420-1:gamma-L-glutamate ligase